MKFPQMNIAATDTALAAMPRCGARLAAATAELRRAMVGLPTTGTLAQLRL